jgi:hypothetical protein
VGAWSWALLLRHVCHAPIIRASFAGGHNQFRPCQEIFRKVAAALLIAIGVVLLLPRVQAQLAVAAGPFGNWAQMQTDGMPTRGLAGQLIALGMLSREALMRWRDRLMRAGKGGKYLLGGLLLLIGALIVTEFDKTLEALLVEASPAWLTQLTTRF